MHHRLDEESKTIEQTYLDHELLYLVI